MARKILAMFPGQGSQHVGMGKELLEQFPKCLPLFEAAEEATRLPIRQLCFEGPEDQLKLTAYTQPCILTVSAAYWQVLKDETGLVPDLFAGHSLGEYSALVAAGILDFSRAAMLVHERGKAMQTAVPEGVGAMAAVMKCPADKLETLCAKHSTGTQSVQVVNYNSEAQLVVAGHKEAVEALKKELEELGYRVVGLPVSAPFHSRLMAPAAKAMKPLLEDTAFDGKKNRIIANTTGGIVSNYTADYLIRQIDSPVLWIQSIHCAVEEGVNTYLEIGPSKVLTGLVRRMVPRGPEIQVLAAEDIADVIKSLNS